MTRQWLGSAAASVSQPPKVLRVCVCVCHWRDTHTCRLGEQERRASRKGVVSPTSCFPDGERERVAGGKVSKKAKCVSQGLTEGVEGLRGARGGLFGPEIQEPNPSAIECDFMMTAVRGEWGGNEWHDRSDRRRLSWMDPQNFRWLGYDGGLASSCLPEVVIPFRYLPGLSRPAAGVGSPITSMPCHGG